MINFRSELRERSRAMCNQFVAINRRIIAKIRKNKNQNKLILCYNFNYD